MEDFESLAEIQLWGSDQSFYINQERWGWNYCHKMRLKKKQTFRKVFYLIKNKISTRIMYKNIVIRLESTIK